MNGKFLLDTNVVIDYLGGTEGFDRLDNQLAGARRYVSVITRMELLSYPGITPKGEDRIHRFLADLTVMALNEEIETAGIAIRRACRLKLPDAIIAAAAVILGATLITSDQRLTNIEWPGSREVMPV